MGILRGAMHGVIGRRRNIEIYELATMDVGGGYFDDGGGISCSITWLRRVLLRDPRVVKSAEVRGLVIDVLGGGIYLNRRINHSPRISVCLPSVTPPKQRLVRENLQNSIREARVPHIQ